MKEPKRNSDINSLSPVFRQKFDLWWVEVLEKYPNARIFEAIRSKERQQWLYGVGRTHSMTRKPVTWTLDSRHLGGCAVDVVFDHNGVIKREGPYMELIEIAKKYGILNLYPKETCHFEDDGKPLFIENTLMLFYEKLWNDNYSKVPENERQFKDPKSFLERTKNLSIQEQLSEMVFLIAIIAEKSK